MLYITEEQRVARAKYLKSIPEDKHLDYYREYHEGWKGGYKSLKHFSEEHFLTLLQGEYQVVDHVRATDWNGRMNRFAIVDLHPRRTRGYTVQFRNSDNDLERVNVVPEQLFATYNQTLKEELVTVMRKHTKDQSFDYMNSVHAVVTELYSDWVDEYTDFVEEYVDNLENGGNHT